MIILGIHSAFNAMSHDPSAALIVKGESFLLIVNDLLIPLKLLSIVSRTSSSPRCQPANSSDSVLSIDATVAFVVLLVVVAAAAAGSSPVLRQCYPSSDANKHLSPA